MNQDQEIQQEALRTYEWNESNDALVRKENRQIVATVTHKKASWIATDKSGSKTIGEYEGKEAARRAINERFGLEIPSGKNR